MCVDVCVMECVRVCDGVCVRMENVMLSIHYFYCV